MPNFHIGKDIDNARDQLRRARCPEALQRIFWFNEFEEALSKRFYEDFFYKFLEISNYSFSRTPEKNDKGEEGASEVITSTTTRKRKMSTSGRTA